MKSIATIVNWLEVIVRVTIFNAPFPYNEFGRQVDGEYFSI